jgi:hypothetical protein
MRRLLILPFVLGTVSCGDSSTTSASQLNLDRPVDIAFACYGGLRINHGAAPKPTDPIEITAQPIEGCETRSGEHEAGTPQPVPAGQEDLTAMGGPPIAGTAWYGFILQSAPGTVAIAQWTTKPSSAFAGGDVLMLDGDPLTPGKNGISVGEDPIAITTDRVGCYEVVANAGSCDLSAVDTSSAIAAAIGSDTARNVRVNRIDVKNASGQVIRAKPAAMVGEPAGGTIGESCSTTPQGLVYIAYPSCHVVAAVDTSTGTIVSSIDYSSGTPTLGGGNISCPDECGGGGTVTAGIRPVAIDLELDPRTQERKLVIGAENSNSISIVELGSDTRPVSVRQVDLEEKVPGTLGITAIALSPTIGMGGNMGVINDDIAAGGDFQFAYAVATDDTVRVAEVSTINRECDTQVDPRLIDKETNIATLSCFKVGDPATPRRRPGARSPGIELLGDAIPTSVDVFKAKETNPDPRLPGPTKLVGYFGVITSTDGRSFVFNVDDDDYADFKNQAEPLEVWMPLAIAHQLRDFLGQRNFRATTLVGNTEKPICDTAGPDPDAQAGNYGGPRAVNAPSRTVPTGIIAPEKVPELPTLRNVLCTGEDDTKPVAETTFAAPDAVRDLEYPDLRALKEETWSMTWEGSLSLDKANAAIDGPPVRVGQMFVDNTGFRLVDKSKPFCDAGVEQFDTVQLRGCDPSIGDAECPIGYTCFVHPNSQVAGLGACMLIDEADRLADACKDFLTSLRRYTVNRTESGELTLLPRKHVLPATPVDGCVDDNQCKSLADYAAKNAGPQQPQDAMQTDPHSYKCMVDTERAPIAGTGKRCVESCTQTSDCTTGRICQQNVCMEGVVPPQACVNAPQRFELRSHDAFTLVGSASGYVHPIIQDSTGKCIKDPNAHPFDVARIPLAPPPCDPAADPRTGLLPSGAYDVNPCSLTVDHTETVPSYIANSCVLSDPPTVIATRQAPAVRIHTRGPTLTMVDPYQSGDQRCIRDRAGNLGKIPLVFSGYQLSWRQTGGFASVALPIAPSFPVKVVRGPQQSIWVIDEGDFLSTSVTQPSTRGKVFRIEAQAIGQVNLLE